MSDKHVRMTIEFDIDQEALDEHGLTAQDVFKGLAFHEDDVIDGFNITTDIQNFDRTANFFLCSGSVVSKEFIPERSRCDGLDKWRDMAREEIDLNGVSCYGLSEKEAAALQADADIIDTLAKKIWERMLANDDYTEYDALNFVFEQEFPELLLNHRLSALGTLACDADIEENRLSFGDISIFLGENDDLFCLLPDEDEPRPLRGSIEDIQEGDAFLFGDNGLIRTTHEKAHQNFDEPDNPWIVYGNDGDCYFEEDIGKELARKVKNLLSELNPESPKKPTLFEQVKAAQAQKSKQVSDVDINSNIKDWYMLTFPTDPVGREIRDSITFNDIVKTLNSDKAIYEVLGGGDSVVRERIFEKISKILGVDYGVIYDKWLDPDKHPDIIPKEIKENKPGKPSLSEQIQSATNRTAPAAPGQTAEIQER